MKKHSRQASNGYRLDMYLDNDLINKKHQKLLKTYRKKYEFLQPSTFQSIQLRQSNMNKLKNTQYHSKVLSKSQFRKSQEKRIVTRISTEHHQKNNQYQIAKFENVDLSTRHKLQKISKIIKIKPEAEGDVKNLYKKIQQNNEQYLILMKQWKRMSNFDEKDELIQQIIRNYMNIIDQIIKKQAIETIQKMNRFQEIIIHLAKQNERLQNECYQMSSRMLDQTSQLQFRILGQYQKNQWSTIIFNQLQKSGFNLEQFVASSEFYKRWAIQLFDKNFNQKKYSEKQQQNEAQKLKRLQKDVQNQKKDRYQSTEQKQFKLKNKQINNKHQFKKRQ